MFGLTTLILGSLAILAAVGFLTFLWMASMDAIRGRPTPRLWNMIVEPAWTARAVTLSSVLLRSAISLQAGLVAAMMAALVLETGGIRLSKLPQMSLLRAVHTGPQNVAWLTMGNLTSLAPRPHILLIFVILATTIASQFSSTLLLLDFTNQNVLLGLTAINVTYGMNAFGPNSASSAGTGNNFWRASPQRYPRFAEYSESSFTGEDMQDTGATFRALLPFQSDQDRKSLRNYSGPATVLNSRVVCVRPLLQLWTTQVINIVGDMQIILGVADTPQDYSMLSRQPWSWDDEPGSFNCTMEMAPAKAGNWELGLCGVRSIAWFKREILDGFSGASTATVLLLNKSGSHEEWFPGYPEHNITLLSDWEPSASGVWSTWSSPNSSAALSVTMCFVGAGQDDYQISAGSDATFEEPVLKWDDHSGTFITDDIRRLYGVLPGVSTDERGVLSMHRTANWTSVDSSLRSGVETSQFVWYATYDGFHTHNGYISTPDPGAILSPLNRSDGAAIHRVHCAIFQDVIQGTGNAAYAVQTLYTILLQMAYYDFLPQFDVSSAVVYSLSTVVNIPSQWVGFIFVATLVCAHFLIVLATLLLFWWKTEHSLVGNSWQAVAQVMTECTLPVLESSWDRTDREIEKSLKASGLDDSLNGVLRIRTT